MQQPTLEQLFNNQIAPLIDGIEKNKKIKSYVGWSIPTITLALTIIQFIRLGFNLGILWFFIFLAFALIVYGVINVVYFKPLSRNIENTFYQPILDAFFPEFSLLIHPNAHGVSQSGIFRKSRPGETMGLNTHALFRSNNDSKQFECGTINVRYATPDSSSEGTKWTRAFEGLFISQLLPFSTKQNLLIKERDNDKVHWSKKFIKKAKPYTTGNQDFDSIFEILSTDKEVNLSFLNEVFYSNLLAVKNSSKGKIYLSIRDQHIFVAVERIRAPRIGVYTDLDIKLAEHVHTYFTKAQMIRSALDFQSKV